MERNVEFSTAIKLFSGSGQDPMVVGRINFDRIGISEIQVDNREIRSRHLQFPTSGLIDQYQYHNQYRSIRQLNQYIIDIAVEISFLYNVD